MTALLNSQLDLLNNVAASDKTLTELVGVEEALQEISKHEETSRPENSNAEDFQDTAIYRTDEFKNPETDSKETESVAAEES